MQSKKQLKSKLLCTIMPQQLVSPVIFIADWTKPAICNGCTKTQDGDNY